MYLVNESASDGQFELVENKMVGPQMPKVRIKTILQTLDEVNKNNRLYPKKILERAVDEIKPLVASKKLLGELDHPLITGNEQADTSRHFLVLYEKASHIIEDIRVEGNIIYGTVSTCLTENGFKMSGLILDGVPVGFSLRGVGDTKYRSDGSMEITDPFSIVTYDCVSSPSHAKARMTEIVKENVQKLHESTNVESMLSENIICDRRDLLSMFVENHMPKCGIDKVIFNLKQNINKNKLYEAEGDVNSLISGYMSGNPEYAHMDVREFLDDHINARGPIESLFKKYLSH